MGDILDFYGAVFQLQNTKKSANYFKPMGHLTKAVYKYIHC